MRSTPQVCRHSFNIGRADSKGRNDKIAHAGSLPQNQAVLWVLLHEQRQRADLGGNFIGAGPTTNASFSSCKENGSSVTQVSSNVNGTNTVTIVAGDTLTLAGGVPSGQQRQRQRRQWHRHRKPPGHVILEGEVAQRSTRH
jgi:hypothetical protein